MKVLTKPTVRFTQKAFQQMFALTDECKIEISAMGVLATEEQKAEWGVTDDFYVLDFHVPDQECTGGSTVMETDSYADISLELRDQGIKPEQICVWWHSHVNMGVGHSGTDESQIEDFNFDNVCVSIITNKKREINVRVDVFNPVRYSFEKCNYAVDQVSILEDGWAKEMVDTHVSSPAPTRMVVGKTKTAGTITSYGRYGSYTGKTNGHTTNWKGHWDEDYVGWGEEVEDDKSAKDSEEVGAVEYVKETLRLPHELDSLEELYEEDVLDLTEVLEYYAKWYAKEISTEELEDELQNLYYEPKSRKSKDEPGDEEVQAILNAEFGEDDEDEDEPIGVAV